MDYSVALSSDRRCDRMSSVVCPMMIMMSCDDVTRILSRIRTNNTSTTIFMSTPGIMSVMMMMCHMMCARSIRTCLRDTSDEQWIAVRSVSTRERGARVPRSIIARSRGRHARVRHTVPAPASPQSARVPPRVRRAATSDDTSTECAAMRTTRAAARVRHKDAGRQGSEFRNGGR